MYTIENTIEIAAPAHRIIEALTTEAGYRGWWTDEASYDGKAARFPFRNRDGARIVTFRVDQADARGVVMTCTAQEDNPDWLGTKLAISVEGGHVRLVHSGYPAKNETYERCVQGWAYFVTSLKSYVETGAGTPYKNAAC